MAEDECDDEDDGSGRVIEEPELESAEEREKFYQEVLLRAFAYLVEI